jgi:LEA14-like dessication related protein
MLKPSAIIVLFLLAFLLTNCSVNRQVRDMKNFARCEFRVESVTEIRLAGIRLQDAGFLEMAKITGVLAAGQLPLDLTLNLSVHNPNPIQAGLNRIDYIVLIDDQKVGEGFMDQPVSLNGQSTTLIPVPFHTDLYQVMTGKSADAILNFGLNLANAGSSPTRFTLRMKPTLVIGGFPLSYPGYIDVTEDYTSN